MSLHHVLTYGSCYDACEQHHRRRNFGHAFLFPKMWNHSIHSTANPQQLDYTHMLSLSDKNFSTDTSQKFRIAGSARIWDFRQTLGRTVYNWLPYRNMYNIFRGCRRLGTTDSCQALCSGYHGAQSSTHNDNAGCHPMLHCAAWHAAQRGQLVSRVYCLDWVLRVPHAEDCARSRGAYCGQRLDR